MDPKQMIESVVNGRDPIDTINESYQSEATIYSRTQAMDRAITVLKNMHKRIDQVIVMVAKRKDKPNAAKQVVNNLKDDIDSALGLIDIAAKSDKQY